MNKETSESILKSGTGDISPLTEKIKNLEAKGYIENLIPRYDHFDCQNGTVKLYPNSFTIDKTIRFENTSDPEDQSILYAISSEEFDLKGIYIESYGLYHDDLSSEFLQKLINGIRQRTNINQNPEPK